MRRPVMIGPELATAIHHRLAAEHGGPADVRDAQALADALAAVTAGRGRPDLFAMAAGYAAEVVARRPFAAGNVRTAFALATTFLAANGVDVTADGVELAVAMRRLADGAIDRAALAGVLAGRPPSPRPPTAGATAGRPHPVRRSAMDYVCPRCGCTVAEPGSVHSTGRMYFRPANAKFLTLKTGDIELKANACTGCGHVDFVASVDKLDALTRRAEPV